MSDGNDVRQQTLSERRAQLKNLIGDDANSRIQFGDEFHGEVLTCFGPSLSGRLRALSQSMHWHLIDLAEAGLGSRPSASGLTVTARPAHSWKAPTFSTTDTTQFNRAVDTTDDELAVIAARAKLTVV